MQGFIKRDFTTIFYRHENVNHLRRNANMEWKKSFQIKPHVLTFIKGRRMLNNVNLIPAQSYKIREQCSTSVAFEIIKNKTIKGCDLLFCVFTNVLLCYYSS